MDPRFSEDEQTEKLRAWWKENRWSIIGGVGLGLAVVVGWNAWQTYSVRRAEQASELYQRVKVLSESGQPEAADAAGSELRESYTSSPYAGKAALLLARSSVADGELSAARTHLSWAMEHAVEAGTRHAARLRLGRVLLEEGKLDEAEALLRVEATDGFATHYAELLGDVYAAMGKPNQAREAYQQSLDSLPAGSNYAALLSLKIGGLAVAEEGQ